MASSVKKDFSQIFNTLIADVSSFGSLVFYGIVVLFALLLSQFMVATQLVLALVLSMGIASIVRFIFPRDRPIKQHASASFISKIDASSFPSIHSARAICLAWILSANGVILPVAFGVWVVAILVCISRIVLGRHYPSDVFAGALLGLLVSFVALRVVPYFFFI